MQNKRGFTLLELLIVITIIGLLISVVVASLDSARVSSRDTARMQQAIEFTKALELYYTENGMYPDDLSAGTPVQLVTVHSQFSTYISRVPADPVFATNQTYLYCSSPDLSSMSLIIRTENPGAGTDPNLCVVSMGPQAYTDLCTGISGYETCGNRI